MDSLIPGLYIRYSFSIFFFFPFPFLKVKETTFLRNTIAECQACGKCFSSNWHASELDQQVRTAKGRGGVGGGSAGCGLWRFGTEVEGREKKLTGKLNHILYQLYFLGGLETCG